MAERVATVKNWGTFQHYKDRSPPWIKLHRALLDDFTFSSLPVASKALAPLLWLLAAETQDGAVSIDPDFLAFRLRWKVQDVRSGLTPLIEKGLLVVASKALADCKQVATPETEGETEKETPLAPAAPSEPDGFARFWAAYPKRRREKKAEAMKVWQSHKLDGEADRIIAHVTAQSKTEDWLKDGGQFVPQPPAYLRGKRWLDSEPVAGVAEVPKSATERAIEEAERYARQMVENKAWTPERASRHIEQARGQP